MTLVAVVLNGHQTHYSDTKAMLDFGFANFHTAPISQLDDRFSTLDNDLSIGGIPVGDLSDLSLEEGMITLPLSASIGDADVSVTYQLDGLAPENAIAQVQYTYNDRLIGSAYLLNRTGEEEEIPLIPLESPGADASAPVTDPAGASDPVTDPDADASNPAADASDPAAGSSADTGPQTAPGAISQGNPETSPGEDGFSVPVFVWVLAAVAALAAAAAAVTVHLRRERQRREEDRRRREERRRQRLREIGVSDEEFEQMMAARRAARQSGRGGRKDRS